MLLSSQFREQGSSLFLALLMAFGKRASGDLALLNVVVPCNAKQLLLKDEGSGRIFLVDTGAQVSVVPATPADRNQSKPSASLRAANGSVIHAYGVVSTLQFNGRRFPATLVAANVQRPLLGADFIRRHRLLVDLANDRLIDATTFSTYQCRASPSQDGSRPSHFRNKPVKIVYHTDEFLQIPHRCRKREILHCWHFFQKRSCTLCRNLMTEEC